MPEAAAHHESKNRLLDAAVRVFGAKGYSATTLDDVCRSAELTKGCFFYHFKSKEDLAVASASRFAEASREVMAGAAYRALADPLDRLLGYVELRASLIRGDVGAYSCLLGTLVQEIHETHPVIRAACEQGICDQASEVATDIKLAKDLYAPEANWSAQSLGLYTQAVLQGSFILAKATGGRNAAVMCIEHLQRYLELLFTSSSKACGRDVEGAG